MLYIHFDCLQFFHTHEYDVLREVDNQVRIHVHASRNREGKKERDPSCSLCFFVLLTSPSNIPLMLVVFF